MNFDELKKKVDTFAEQKKIPTPMVYGGIAMAGVLVLCTLFGLVASKPAVQGTAPQAKAPLAVPEHLAAQAAATSMAAVAPGSAQVAVAPASLANALIPAQTAPEGLAPHFTGYALQGRAGEGGAWVVIGTATVPATLADFTTEPRTEWKDVTPTQGRMRVVWQFWTEVPTGGTYTFIVSAHGNTRGSADVHIDDAADATLQEAINGGLFVDDRAQAQVGVGLAKGWHKFVVGIEQGVSRTDDLHPLLLKAYIKGPSDTAPVQITPFAVPPKDGSGAAKESAK